MPFSQKGGKKEASKHGNPCRVLQPPLKSANVLHQRCDDRKQIHTSAIHFVGFPHRSRELPRFTALPGLAVKLDAGSILVTV